MGVPQNSPFAASEAKKFPREIEYCNNNSLFSGEATMNNVSGFYENSKIFITGATGFLGKALVEKLLRSCDGLDSVYVLMRPKRGMAVEQRLKELFKNPVFNRIREKDPDAFEKVKAISGDVSLPNLGIGDGDKAFLVDNINIVFHSAATVKFNEDLKNAVILNTLGTKRVLQICKEMKRLKSFVHVSTAYCNSDKDTVEETVYKPPYDPEAVINCIDVLADEAIDVLAQKMLDKHPNTYTLTKAMAEHIVLENSELIPSAVVRPSIITAAWKEPYPGWVDNISGITGIFMECGRGTIKTIICDEKCRIDVIPVDVVVDTLITAAWHTVANRSNAMRVYNCTSGFSNPITWKKFGELTQKYALEYPSKYVTWYPGFTYRTNRTLHALYATLFHTVPSALLDVFLYCSGQQPMMLKFSRKIYSALSAGSFFSTHEWDFKASTMDELVEAVKHAEDGERFNVDLRESNGFTWDCYVKDFMLGVRKFVLKDDVSSLAKAKIKLNRLYWFQKIFQIVSLYAMLKVTTNFLY
ncbi:putative fatty acyl-CoA reductase CG5065 [Anoplophora glabripennis]|uniref:putative fatty acyl-CoA reductase CG5065 n=1 Tax=Anoplophora glabripennis TaxID=217634 RepID=UPI00087512F2|nr:putative fatty acyl-CoA reductase CG5065 [Anoplophora glabripennis]